VLSWSSAKPSTLALVTDLKPMQFKLDEGVTNVCLEQIAVGLRRVGNRGEFGPTVATLWNIDGNVIPVGYSLDSFESNPPPPATVLNSPYTTCKAQLSLDRSILQSIDADQDHLEEEQDKEFQVVVFKVYNHIDSSSLNILITKNYFVSFFKKKTLLVDCRQNFFKDFFYPRDSLSM
jgi:hypothetical protein